MVVFCPTLSRLPRRSQWYPWKFDNVPSRQNTAHRVCAPNNFPLVRVLALTFLGVDPYVRPAQELDEVGALRQIECPVVGGTVELSVRLVHDGIFEHNDLDQHRPGDIDEADVVEIGRPSLSRVHAEVVHSHKHVNIRVCVKSEISILCGSYHNICR